MTTIAWDGTTLVGDMLIGYGNLTCHAVKIWRLTDGRLYGGSGDYQDILAVKAWLEAGEPEDKKPALESFAAMVIDHEGRCFRLETRLIFLLITEQYHALGSGRDFAMAAMLLGVDARKAVSVAAQFDIYTGEQVMAVTLDG